jgi:hypothetical protein
VSSEELAAPFLKVGEFRGLLSPQIMALLNWQISSSFGAVRFASSGPLSLDLLCEERASMISELRTMTLSILEEGSLAFPTPSFLGLFSSLMSTFVCYEALMFVDF